MNCVTLICKLVLLAWALIEEGLAGMCLGIPPHCPSPLWVSDIQRLHGSSRSPVPYCYLPPAVHWEYVGLKLFYAWLPTPTFTLLHQVSLALPSFLIPVSSTPVFHPFWNPLMQRKREREKKAREGGIAEGIFFLEWKLNKEFILNIHVSKSQF